MAQQRAFVPLEELETGYPKLAGQMGLYPETAIFRTFGALNSQNLALMQAELIYLERRVRQRENFDKHSGVGNRHKYATNWWFFGNSANDGDEEQLRLWERTRALLKEYNAALIQYSTILRLEPPAKYDLNYLQHYLATDDMMRPSMLTGDDLYVWGDVINPRSHCPDLVTLRAREKQDVFSTWVTTKGLGYFFELYRSSGGVRDSFLLRLTLGITTIVASLLPIISIAVLYCVKSMKARLAIIAGFNILVCIALLSFTKVKRSEVFAVSAAFSAVQVVFVGGISGG